LTPIVKHLTSSVKNDGASTVGGTVGRRPGIDGVTATWDRRKSRRWRCAAGRLIRSADEFHAWIGSVDARELA
jgi:hypothetical protein